jgi:tetratricopeptide (TPR) repeat protein
MKSDSINLIYAAIIIGIFVLVAAFIVVYGSIYASERPIHATEAAEVKRTLAQEVEVKRTQTQEAEAKRMQDAKLEEVIDYSLRGDSNMDQEDYERAIANYDKAIELDPTNAIFFANRGFAYQMKENYERAIADFRIAIELDPKNEIAYFLRGDS